MSEVSGTEGNRASWVTPTLGSNGSATTKRVRRGQAVEFPRASVS